MNTQDFFYELPPSLIAQAPLEERSASRMLVLRRSDGTVIDSRVRELPSFLSAGDLMVFNDTRVIPARVRGVSRDTGGSVELLFLEPRDGRRWAALCKCRRILRPGLEFLMGESRVPVTIVAVAENGCVTVDPAAETDIPELMEMAGETPLPPYIVRNKATRSSKLDSERYQTIYAREQGSVAAPTAGLHFDGPLLDRLRASGIGTEWVTLHVGAGTFRPVKAKRVEDHVMDEERYELPASTAQRIQEAKARGGRVVAVGSTTVRTLEAVWSERGIIEPASGRTGLFITPTYRFGVIDAMLTNFHLPCSTLIMMVCALGGREHVLRAYEHAVQEKYRFYSYGDCMLII